MSWLNANKILLQLVCSLGDSATLGSNCVLCVAYRIIACQRDMAYDYWTRVCFLLVVLHLACPFLFHPFIRLLQLLFSYNLFFGFHCGFGRLHYKTKVILLLKN